MQHTRPIPPTNATESEGWKPVTAGLPQSFDEDGLTEALQVATDGRTNIYPHYFTRSRRWVRTGHHGTIANVTHYRAYPADPLPVPEEDAAPAQRAGA